MFICLRELVTSLSAGLTNSMKKVENLADQLSLQYTMSILSTNLSALGFCGISLTDILEQHDYKLFLDMYDNSIVSMIEKGYLEDFEACPE